MSPIHLTDDDVAILRYVNDYRFRRSSDIYRRLSHRSQNKVRERLRKLYDLAYLDRPLAQRDNHLQRGKAHAIYALGNRGSQILSHIDGTTPPKTDWTQKNHQVKQLHLRHTLLTGDLQDAVRRLNLAYPHVEIMSTKLLQTALPTHTRSLADPWEWKVRVPLSDGTRRETTTIPDFVCGLDDTENRKRLYIMCEADRGTEPIIRSNPKHTCFARKLEVYWHGYQTNYHHHRFGLSNIRFLTIAPGSQRIDNMIEALSDITKGGDVSMFYFLDQKSLHQADHIASAPWRDGHGQSASPFAGLCLEGLNTNASSK